MGLAACDGAVITEREFPAFGTDVRIEILDAEADRAALALAAVESQFRVAERDWYAFGSGELARVNALLARGHPATVSADLAPLIARAIQLHGLSGGRFDPGVCALVQLWRFDSAESLAAAAGPPSEAEIRSLQARQGAISDLRFDGQTVLTNRPLCIDLGGMAKGTAVERARAIFARYGIESALLDIGGSSQLAVGQKGGRPWFIGLQHPRENHVIGRLALKPGETTATSGDYEHAYIRDGRRYHHVLDPRTGEPTAGVAGVTVLARDAELAEAATKALMVDGAARFSETCAALGISDALLITTTGALLVTPGMAARLRHDNNGRLPVVDWPKHAADL